MELALTKVKGDYLFILEDDDYYAPQYIQSYVDVMGSVDVVGLASAKYFHVKCGGWKVLGNDKHASLASTAVKKSAIPLMSKAVDSGELYMDMFLWADIHKNNRSHALLGGVSTSVGIKGMPGRGGITPSHREMRDYLIDSDCSVIKSWINEDYALYSPYCTRIKNEIKTREENNFKQKIKDAGVPLTAPAYFSDSGAIASAIKALEKAHSKTSFK
jgi:hypothetical protein